MVVDRLGGCVGKELCFMYLSHQVGGARGSCEQCLISKR